MKVDTIKALLPLIGSKYAGRRHEWVVGSCPLAQWRHNQGTDNHPSFGVKSNNTQESICKCWSCGFGGKLDDLLFELQLEHKKSPAVGVQLKQALMIISNEFSELEFDQDIPDYDEAKKFQIEARVDKPYPEDWMTSFRHVTQFQEPMEYLKSRGVTLEMIKYFDLRYDPIQRRVCFPFRNKLGQLMGMQGRAIDKLAELRYYFYEYGGYKNMQCWLGEHHLNMDKSVVLVEGPFDYASIFRVYQNVAASFSAGVSKEKVRRLADADSIITFYDYGMGGDAARERVEEVMKGTPITHVIPSEESDDAGAMSLQLIAQTLDPLVKLTPFKGIVI